MLRKADEPARAGESDQPGWTPGTMDGELRWGGRSGNRAYLRHGQLRYTVTPEGEGLRFHPLSVFRVMQALPVVVQ